MSDYDEQDQAYADMYAESALNEIWNLTRVATNKRERNVGAYSVVEIITYYKEAYGLNIDTDPHGLDENHNKGLCRPAPLTDGEAE